MSGYAGSPFEAELKASNPSKDYYAGVDLGLKGSLKFPIFWNIEGSAAIGYVAWRGMLFGSLGLAKAFADNHFDIAVSGGYRTGSQISHGYADTTLGFHLNVWRLDLRFGGGGRFGFLSSGSLHVPAAMGVITLDAFLARPVQTKL
jgi:hypothetical protein